MSDVRVLCEKGALILTGGRGPYPGEQGAVIMAYDNGYAFPELQEAAEADPVLKNLMSNTKTAWYLDRNDAKTMALALYAWAMEREEWEHGRR